MCCGVILFTSPICPDMSTMPHVRSRIMVVRMAVARFESTSLTPIFAKIAVKAANSADSSAYIFHMVKKFRCEGEQNCEK